MVVYILSGIYYRIPMPVQPLKAVAAIAIAGALDAGIISAAAIWMSLILMVLALTGLAKYLSRLFCQPIIRGIQFGVGLMLMKSALKLMTYSDTGFIRSSRFPILSVILVVLCVLSVLSILIFSSGKKFSHSSALTIIFVIVLGIVCWRANAAELTLLHFPAMSVSLPTLDNFQKAFWLLVLPQIPLTLGNAVIATKNVADTYFPNRSKKVTERALCLSMGLTNLIAGFAGAMPVCHGSGGLTAHYSFGARAGGASIIIGAVCLALAVTFGTSAAKILKLIPFPVLGAMLFYVGLKHSLLIKDLDEKKDFMLAAGIGILGLLTGNLSIGFGAGTAVYYANVLINRIRKQGTVLSYSKSTDV